MANIQSGTSHPDNFTTLAIGLNLGKSSSVKKVTASPLRPARPKEKKNTKTVFKK
jgi:hypothetical protein